MQRLTGAQWLAQLVETLSVSFHENPLTYFESCPAAAMLGNTVHVYMFVRETLGIPILTGLARFDVDCIDVDVSHIYYYFESGAIDGV